MAVAAYPFNRLWALLAQNLVSLQTNCSYLFSTYWRFSHNSRNLWDQKSPVSDDSQANRRPHRLDHKTSTHLQTREFAPNRYVQHLWPIRECNPSANTAERGEVDTTAMKRQKGQQGLSHRCTASLTTGYLNPKPLEAQRRTSSSPGTFAAKPVIHFLTLWMCAQHATIHTTHSLSIPILSLLIFSSIYDSNSTSHSLNQNDTKR